MPAEHAGYVGKYLSKERPQRFKRWGLWATFGKGWKPTKVKDVLKETLFSKIYQACKEWKGWERRERFYERMDVARQMLLLTIERVWKPGLGLGNKPYWMCSEEELCLGYEIVCDAPF